MSESGRKSASAATLADIGEFGVIQALQQRLSTSNAVLLGPGDDAAVVTATDGRTVVTTDTLVERLHFRTDWAPASDIGRRAAATSLADISAMGAIPTALVVALAAPEDTKLQWVLEFADGLNAEAQAVGAAIVGGDLTRAPSLTVTVTALGDLEGRAPVTRSGAQPGDGVAVCGRLGWAEAGLIVLSRGFSSPKVLVQAYRCPQPPYGAGPAAAMAGATAMADVSDGLVVDLSHIAEASDVTIELESSSFDVPDPIAAVAAAYGVDPLKWVLAGGQDHALTATFPNDTALPAGFILVGEVSPPRHSGEREGIHEMVLVDGQPFVGVPGYQHFSTSPRTT